MKKWLRRMRDAAAMGLAWAAGWALVGMLGVLVFYTLFPDTPDVFDVWIPVFAYPGFLTGVVFSVVLWIAKGRRRFDEVSLTRLGAWGAVSGLLVGLLPFVLGTPNPVLPLWMLGVVIIGPVTLLSSVSAIGTALWFRYRARRRSRASGG